MAEKRMDIVIGTKYTGRGEFASARDDMKRWQAEAAASARAVAATGKARYEAAYETAAMGGGSAAAKELMTIEAAQDQFRRRKMAEDQRAQATAAKADARADTTIDRAKISALREAAAAGDAEAKTKLDLLSAEKAYATEVRSLRAVIRDGNADVNRRVEATRLLQQLEERRAATNRQIVTAAREEAAARQAAAKAEEQQARAEHQRARRSIVSRQLNMEHEDNAIDLAGSRAREMLDRAESSAGPASRGGSRPATGAKKAAGHASGRAALGDAALALPLVAGHEGQIIGAVSAAAKVGMAVAAPIAAIAAIGFAAKHIVDVNHELHESQVKWNSELRESAEHWAAIARAQGPTTAPGANFNSQAAEFSKSAREQRDAQEHKFRELGKYRGLSSASDYFGMRVEQVANSKVGLFSIEEGSEDDTSFRKQERLDAAREEHALNVAARLKNAGMAQDKVQRGRNAEDRQAAVEAAQTGAMFEGTGKRRLSAEQQIAADRRKIEREGQDKVATSKVANDIARSAYYSTNARGTPEAMRFEAEIGRAEKDLADDNAAALAAADEQAGIAKAALERDQALERSKFVAHSEAELRAAKLDAIDDTAGAALERMKAAHQAQLEEMERAGKSEAELTAQQNLNAQQVANAERQKKKATEATQASAAGTLTSGRVAALQISISQGDQGAAIEANRLTLLQQELTTRKALQDIIDNPLASQQQKTEAAEQQKNLAGITEAAQAEYKRRLNNSTELGAMQLRASLGDKAAAAEARRFQILQDGGDQLRQLASLAAADPSRKAQLDHQQEALKAAQKKALIDEKENSLEGTRIASLQLRAQLNDKVAEKELAKIGVAKQYRDVLEQINAELARGDLTAAERARLEADRDATLRNQKRAVDQAGLPQASTTSSGLKSTQSTKDFHDNAGDFYGKQLGGYQKDPVMAKVAEHTAASSAALKGLVDLLTSQANRRAWGENNVPNYQKDLDV